GSARRHGIQPCRCRAASSRPGDHLARHERRAAAGGGQRVDEGARVTARLEPGGDRPQRVTRLHDVGRGGRAALRGCERGAPPPAPAAPGAASPPTTATTRRRPWGAPEAGRPRGATGGGGPRRTVGVTAGSISNLGVVMTAAISRASFSPPLALVLGPRSESR